MDELNSFYRELEGGLRGKNEGIPYGPSRLSGYVSHRKGTNAVWGGFTGSGKTSIVDELCILNPFRYLKHHGRLSHWKGTYWSMERKKEFKIAKWHANVIFRDTREVIPMERILGWVHKEHRLTHNEHDLIMSYKGFFEELFSHIQIIDGRQNPTGIRKFIRAEAEKYGKIEEIDEYHKVYLPNDEELLYMNIFDHAGKLKKEKGKSTKDTIDDFSDDCSNTYRDFYNMCNHIISQFNRDINNPMRLKAGDVEPRIEDFKDTSDLGEDADFTYSLFDPWRYNVPDPSGYDLSKLRDPDGSKKYRSFKILKNSYGAEGVRVGMAYQPQTGIFKELPTRGQMTESIYTQVLDNSYFL